MPDPPATYSIHSVSPVSARVTSGAGGTLLRAWPVPWGRPDDGWLLGLPWRPTFAQSRLVVFDVGRVADGSGWPA
ncbi:hypothetical protein [Komagataeibacter diospyri]|uniref:hypothetical protein n=1 Tax=Komagataeibacter diospyri TaxID=1932662 RepID=UPI001875075B|nr:hypothetical protein [Komagataeibacter diospyri]